MLNTDPEQWPDCTQILQMPQVIWKIQHYFPEDDDGTST